MKGHFPLISALVALLLLTAGCFGRGERAAAPDSEPTATTSAPVAVETATPSAPADAEEEAPSAEDEPAAETEDETEGETEESGGDEADTSESETSESENQEEAADAMPLMGEVRAVEDVPEINSYRTHITVNSQTERGEDYIEAEGAYVKEPKADQLTVTFLQGDETQQIATLYVDGVRYLSMGDTWMQSPAQTFSNISELTLMTPQNISGIIPQMEVIGTETVNGLVATHYRGSKEIIPIVGTEGDTLDVSRVESAQIDIWGDETYNAIIKLTLEARNTEPPMTATITFDYTDINSDIIIEAPETLPVSEEPVAEGDFVPNNELGALLGFNLMFPTGSTVETVVGTSLYVVVGPYGLEQATNMIELNMEANGYSQISKSDGPGGGTLFIFQQGDKIVSITLTEAGDEMTRFQFATGQ